MLIQKAMLDTKTLGMWKGNWNNILDPTQLCIDCLNKIFEINNIIKEIEKNILILYEKIACIRQRFDLYLPPKWQDNPNLFNPWFQQFGRSILRIKTIKIQEYLLHLLYLFVDYLWYNILHKIKLIFFNVAYKPIMNENLVILWQIVFPEISLKKWV